MTDSTLTLVARWGGLQELSVTRSKITDHGLSSLAGLSNLKRLTFQDSVGVGDDGIRHLRALSRLQVLGLSGTEVGDAGLARLTTLNNLGRLVVGRRVTDEGLDTIRQALPRIKIIRYSSNLM